MTDSSHPSAQQLASLLGLDQLADVQYSAIASLFRIRTLHIGEPLLLPEASPAELFLLYAGELRQLVDHPAKSGRSLTIALHRPPFIAGWASLQASQPLEFLTAASDCSLFAVSAADWRQLLHQFPAIGLYAQHFLSVADLWPLLSQPRQPELSLPAHSKELRPWLGRLVCEGQVRYITPGQASAAPFNPAMCWFVACGGHPLAYGANLAIGQIPALQAELQQPLRLIGLPQVLWGPPAGVAITPGAAPSSLPAPAPPAAESSPVQGLEPEELDPAPFRFFAASAGPVAEAIACFRTIAHQLHLPIKVDVLQRILHEQVSRGDGSVSLQLCAAIAESLGLQTQLVQLPLAFVSRLETPSLVHLSDGELAVALAARTDELVLARPRTAIEALTPEQLAPLALEDGTLPVLLLRTLPSTPKARFGLKWFLPAIRKNRRALVEVLVASLFVQLFQLMNPLIIQQIIDKVIGQNGMSTLPVLGVLLIGFSLFENLLTGLRTNLFVDTTNRIDISLGEVIIDHLLKLPLHYFDRRPVGELSSRLSEMENIRSFLTGTALTVVLDSVFSVIYIAVMLVYSWILTIVALLVVPLLALITIGISPVVRDQLRHKAELNAKTQSHLVEVLSGIQTVKAQNFELKARWKWKENYASFVAEGFRNAMTATTANALTNFLNQLSNLLVICVGAWLVLEGQLTLGGLIAFRIIAGYVTGPLLRLVQLWQSFQQTSLSLERLADIVDTPQESELVDRTNIPMPQITGRIVYEDLCFRFGKEGPLQLANVNVEIEPGQFVAIVGQSGSGKSTMTKLLPRLYPPLSGRIFIDGFDIAKVELYSLRRQIGIVPQESLLFEGTVQDNIGLTNPEATSDDIIAAARIACAHDFIMQLPMGYNTPVGERGGSLSGGQRQRIAIARTVLQNPRILIMDEATSALDLETERRVSLNLMEALRGRTVLFITHRLNSIRGADRILLMHDGSLAEDGSHDELMAMRGRYYALFRQQEAAGASSG